MNGRKNRRKNSSKKLQILLIDDEGQEKRETCDDPYSTIYKRASIIFFCNVIIVKNHCRKNVTKMIEKLK